MENEAKTVGQQIWAKALAIEEEYGGKSLKIEKCLKKQIGVDCRRAANASVQEELDSLDLDYILSTRTVWGVEYLYWHETELGSC